MTSGGVLLAPSFQDLQQALNRKQTFEGTCKSLAERTEVLSAPECRPLLARARTLLRSRFTTRPFWVAGRELFRAALAHAGSDAGLRQQLAEYIAECDEFLGDAPGTSAAGEATAAGSAAAGAPADSATTAMFAGVPAAPAAGGYLFEGQLAGAGARSPPHPQPSLMDMLSGALARQLAGAQAQTQAQQQGGEQERDQDGGAEGQQQQQQQQGEAAEGQQQAEQEPEQQLAPDVLEAIEQELDAIAVRLMEETGQAAAAQRAAPPASKRVVASLPKESLTVERLGQLGGPGTRCPVCMDELSAGDEVQVMPCRHVFHPPCLAPWLADNNSCPTCRHVLPTDDWRYEDRKERARVEEEERRGAANAVSHNEFLYI